MIFKKAASYKQLQPGQWAIDPMGLVWIRCPHDHGHRAVIAGRNNSADWKIDETGRVMPSVWWKDEDCAFHEFITLEGWGA